MKKSFILIALTAGGLNAGAQVKTTVTEFNMAGPFAVQAPVGMDSVDVNGRKFDKKSLMDNLTLSAEPTTVFSGKVLPSLKDSKSVGILSFFVNNRDYVKGSVSVKGPKNYKLYVDGQEAGGEVKLAPEHHTLAIKYLAEPSDTDSVQVTMDMSREVVPTLSKKHPYMVHDLTDGKRVRDARLSADGKYVIVAYQTTARGGKSQWDYELREVKGQRLLQRLNGSKKWMPRSIAYIDEETQGGKRILYKVDPLTLIFTCTEEGPKEDENVYQVLEMDDRQPGWRSRSYLKRYDIKSGLCQRITFGNKGESLFDISQDGKKLLVVSSYSRLEKRPTEVQDVFIIDAQTLKVDTLLQREGFLGGCQFSPDGSQVLFMGNPEAFNRIGCQLPADRTPSMTEYELFLYDIATKQVKALTKDFDPNVDGGLTWSAVDGNIYFYAECRDYVYAYQLNPKTGKIVQLPCKGDYIYRFDMASHATTIAWLSYNTTEPASAYVIDLKSKKQQTFFDGKTALGDAELGTCQDYNFKNSKGDTVYGRLYLPKDFDATKKYPMIVYYYGGCSPVSRYFESPYAPQYWNSLGYVAYIVEPSGATGFGQEWASRHVNTAGHGPAEDIIEGVKQICADHPYINKDKIGCMGASYGGFMTQYLQTQTDIFAAAVSHASAWPTVIPGAIVSCMWTRVRCLMPTRFIRLCFCYMAMLIQMCLW